MIWTFYDQVVKAKKGCLEQEFVLLFIAALPSEARLPNEKISCRIDHLPRMTGTMQATVMIFQLVTTAPMTMTNVMPKA